MPNGEETYTIDLDSETVVVPFEKLVLDQEKARMLQDKVVTKNYDRLSKCKYLFISIVNYHLFYN